MASGNGFKELEDEDDENNFKLYGKEIEDEAAGPSPEMEEDIANQLHVVKQRIGIIDLYLGKLVDLIIAMLGGGKEEEGHSNNDSDDSPKGKINS